MVGTFANFLILLRLCSDPNDDLELNPDYFGFYIDNDCFRTRIHLYL